MRYLRLPCTLRGVFSLQELQMLSTDALPRSPVALAILCALASSSLSAAESHAPATLEEVVVTALKRSTLLQETRVRRDPQRTRGLVSEPVRQQRIR
jgi:hypothetical protein